MGSFKTAFFMNFFEITFNYFQQLFPDKLLKNLTVNRNFLKKSLASNLNFFLISFIAGYINNCRFSASLNLLNLK